TAARLPAGGSRQAPREASRSCRLLRALAQRLEADPLDPIAKAFARRAVRTELDEHRAEQGWNRANRHVWRVQAVETRAVEVPRQHDVVLAEGGADKADIAQIRTRATVGAAAHPEADPLLAQPELVEHRGDLADERRKRALGLGHGQAARRDGGARHGVADGVGNRLDRRDALFRQELVHAGLLRGLDAGQDHVLLRGQADLRPDLFDDRAQPGAHPHLARVRDAAVLDVDAEVKIPVALLVPAQVVVDRFPAQRFGRLQRERKPLLHLGAKPIEPAVRDRVFETRVLAVAAVPVVALHGDDFAREVDYLVGL